MAEGSQIGAAASFRYVSCIAANKDGSNGLLAPTSVGERSLEKLKAAERGERRDVEEADEGDDPKLDKLGTELPLELCELVEACESNRGRFCGVRKLSKLASDEGAMVERGDLACLGATNASASKLKSICTACQSTETPAEARLDARCKVFCLVRDMYARTTLRRSRQDDCRHEMSTREKSSGRMRSTRGMAGRERQVAL